MSPSDRPWSQFGEAPPGAALVLAAIDVAVAAWLICAGVGSIATAHRRTVDADTGFWAWSYVDTLPIAFILLIISVASLAHGTGRSVPRTFRILLAGTITMVVAGLLPCLLGLLGVGT